MLELNGSLRHNPDRARARANEPKPKGELGNPPAYFTASEKRLWRELAKMAHPGVLTCMDRWTVESICILMAKLRARAIKTQELGLLISLLARCGFTPADRSRVNVPPAEGGGNEWDEFTPISRAV